MALVEKTVHSVVGSTWNDSVLRLGRLRTEDSYITIFGHGDNQHTRLRFLENHPDIKILFKGPKAVNGSRYHGTEPRNTIVVYEYEPKVSL